VFAPDGNTLDMILDGFKWIQTICLKTQNTENHKINSVLILLEKVKSGWLEETTSHNILTINILH